MTALPEWLTSIDDPLVAERARLAWIAVASTGDHWPPNNDAHLWRPVICTNHGQHAPQLLGVIYRHPLGCPCTESATEYVITSEGVSSGRPPFVLMAGTDTWPLGEGPAVSIGWANYRMRIVAEPMNAEQKMSASENDADWQVTVGIGSIQSKCPEGCSTRMGHAEWMQTHRDALDQRLPYLDLSLNG